MKENIYLRWALGACLMAAVAFGYGSDRPEPNAFLNKSVHSVSELVREVQSDPDVADRYVRHFGKSKEDVMSYFRTLHLAKLNADGTYIMYSVDDNGIIKSHPELMKAGTLVYADSNGVPILKAKCGNALVSGSNQVAAMLNPTVGNTVDTMRTVPINASQEANAILPQTAVMTPTEPVALAPVMPPPTGSSNQGFALPAALAAIGGAGAFLVGNGGSSPVPEPASIVVIAGALVAMKARRKAKK